MNLKYAIVFMVQILNDYYTDLQCADLDITPTDDTVAILNGQRMLYKTIGNNFVVLVKVDDSGKPFIALDPTVKLRFNIGINNTDFINYTNINYRPLTQGKYYFTNINQTTLNTVLYLSAAVSLYKNTNTYSIGDLAADGSNNVYEAIKGSSKTNKHALTDTAYWRNKGIAQYVNGNDAIAFTGSNCIITTASASDFTIKIYGLTTATSAYTTLLATTTQNFPIAQTSVAVDLTGMTYGKYRISVNGVDTFVYYDEVAVKQNNAGIIEIFNYLPVANDFALFDTSGVPKQKTFTVRFANRSAIWKYITRTTDITAIKDTTAAYKFNTVAASKVFTSDVPIPFSDHPIVTISVHSATLGNVTHIGNPGANRLSNITQSGEIYYCTEKYLNF